MENIYLAIVAFLFILAIFDLVVGVSNDAVNFLNSAVGAKAASFKTVIIIAAIGVFIGATMSDGMMEIARHGIYQPQHFYFSEIMCILLAVMLTDVVLLDVFNSLGLPTSTTVSMVFELLGGTFAIAMIKASNTDLSIAQLINTDKALSVIMGIFLSVAIAFFFGLLVQYISRIIFSFNYKKKMKYTIGAFGGIAITAIIYFILIKGLKHNSLVTDEAVQWIKTNTITLILASFVVFTLLMQFLHSLKVNVFKIIVLLGTFSLALAFAGNDLVNFIGVPLAGYSSFVDFTASSGADPNNFLMSSLLEPARTPWYFLFIAGAIMVYSLWTSKKAHSVINTSVNLARQDEGEESFGSTPMARSLVRFSLNISRGVSKIVPQNVQNWIETRFRKNEAIIADGAAFDLVRASVNLVLASLLITIGTSLKLPLSTTYVTFMVAMGTSLADRAWGRDSAVFRITGVLSVVGGWFLTAGAAFTFCFLVALILHFGGTAAVVVMIALAIFLLVRSQIVYKRKKAKAQEGETFKQIFAAETTEEAIRLLQKYTTDEQVKIVSYAAENYKLAASSFLSENLRGLRKARGAGKFQKQLFKQIKRRGTVVMGKLDSTMVLEKGLYYYQGYDFAGELISSINRFIEPCLEHVDNNFQSLEEIQIREFGNMVDLVAEFLRYSESILRSGDFTDIVKCIRQSNQLNAQLSFLKREELTRIQNKECSIKVSMVYLTMIQETQNMVTYTTNLLKVSKRFQEE